MGELRDRMVQEMRVRNFSPRPQEAHPAASAGPQRYQDDNALLCVADDYAESLPQVLTYLILRVGLLHIIFR